MAKVMFLDNVLYEGEDAEELFPKLKKEILDACEFIRYDILTTYFKRPGDSDEEYYENLKELNPELRDMLECIRQLTGDPEAYYVFMSPSESGIMLYYHSNGKLEFTSIAKIGIELEYDVTYKFKKRTLRLEKDEPVDMEIMKAGMLGLMVGDALGVPVEFMTREEIAFRENGPVTDLESGGTHNMPAGTWSDDSSMALATLDSIREKGGIDLTDIMDKFVLWNYKGEYTPDGFTFDVGNTCDEAIMNYKKNKDVTTCGRTGEYANGNGALMRILSVSVYWANRQMNSKKDIKEDAIASIEQVGALTHNHLRSGIACGIHYFITKNILTYKGKLNLNEIIQKAIDEAFDFYSKYEAHNTELVYYEELSEIDELRKYDSKKIISSGYVVESLIAAVWCLVTTNSYRECVLKAVNLGDDTDTTAAIAGGLAGLYYGYTMGTYGGKQTIPDSWMAKLRGKNVIKRILNI